MSAQYRRPPTPARVFWIRRAVVFGVPAVLVLLLFSALTGRTTPSATPKATLTHSPTSSAAPRPTAQLPAGPAPVSAAPGTALAAPDGPCAASDVIATPTLATPSYAGGPIAITVQLAATRPACTFEISGANLAVKVTAADGSDIWRSQACPASVASGSVIVRSSVTTPVTVTWDGHRSGAGCGSGYPWVGAGNYNVIAAVIGSAPSQAQFALSLPPPPVVTQTASPVPAPSSSPTPAAPASSKKP